MTGAALANPGHGYLPRERLGQGVWKEVYRAVYRKGWEDRALVRFIAPEPNVTHILEELGPALQLRSNQPRHIAEIYDAFVGDDGRVYLAEELLYRPLDRLSPLARGDQFLRIARDLCDGLEALHKRDLIHRDLKLDNCGVDFAGRAKLFDLGLVTNDGGQVKGTILTRAPELFEEDAKHTRQSDVWALGGLLLALRTGNYPFVTRDQALNRPAEGAARDRFNDGVRSQYKAADAEARLYRHARHVLPSAPADLICRMLAFDPSQRPTAGAAREEVERLFAEWLAPGSTTETRDDVALARDIGNYLTAVLRGTGMSARQWNRVVRAMRGLEAAIPQPELQELRKLMDKAQERRSSP